MTVTAETSLRATAGRLPTGVTVIGVAVDGEPHAMTANSFTTVSLDPPLVLVCVRRSGRMAGLLPRAGAFGVTVLPAGAAAVSHRFAAPDRPAGQAGFGPVGWHPAPATGSPVLDCGLAWFDCTVDTVLAAGDHDVCIGRVHACDHVSGGAPLVFAGGGYHGLVQAGRVP